MPIYNMHEAKTNLSRLAQRAANGEEIVLARSGRPVAKLVAIEERAARTPGAWSGKIWISDDFDDPLPEELQRHFEGQQR